MIYSSVIFHIEQDKQENEMSVCAVQRDKDVRRAAAAGLLF